MISTSTRNPRIHSAAFAAARMSLCSTVICSPRRIPTPCPRTSKLGFCPVRAITSGGDVDEPASVLRTLWGVVRGAGCARARHRRGPRQLEAGKQPGGDVEQRLGPESRGGRRIGGRGGGGGGGRPGRA